METQNRRPVVVSEARTTQIIQSRQEACRAFDAMEVVLVKLGDAVDPSRFWECLATYAAAKVGKEVGIKAPPIMDNDKAGHYAKTTTIEYGKFAGELVADVPKEYLAWLTETEFAKDLGAYVRSEYFRRLPS